MHSPAVRSQRPPIAYEFDANGAHIATSADEVGGSSLSKESSRNLDVALKWKQAQHNACVGAFYNRFSNYIHWVNTGQFIGADGEPNPTGRGCKWTRDFAATLKA